jgi:hypothetical protein
MSQIAGDVAIVESFDPFDWQVKPCPGGDLEMRESHILNVPFWFLVIGPLVFCHLVPQPSYLFAKMVFHLAMSCLMGSDSFK